MPNCKIMMPAASDNGSQPYRKAFRFFEMAGKEYPPIYYSLPLGRRHVLRMSLTYGKVLCVWCVALTSHFETPKGVSVWLATIV